MVLGRGIDDKAKTTEEYSEDCYSMYHTLNIDRNQLGNLDCTIVTD